MVFIDVTNCFTYHFHDKHPNSGMILHQENVLGVPNGYVEIDKAGEYYCARSYGDCGADLPIFRFRTDSSSATSNFSLSFIVCQ